METVLETDSLAQQYRSLVASKRLKKQLSAVEDAVDREQKWMLKWDAQLIQDFKEPDKINWKWWEKELEKLEKLKENDDPEIQRMVYRLRFDLFARIHSRKNTLLHQQSEAQSNLINAFLARLNPNSN